MRRWARITVAVLAASALFCTPAAAQDWAMRGGSPTKLFTNLVLAPSGSDGCFQTSTSGASAPGGGFGMVVIRATCSTGTLSADSLAADSLAFEAFVYADLSVSPDTTAFSPIDLDDSSPRLDGFFCTTMDSLALATVGNLSPIAAGQPEYPTSVSRRVIFGSARNAVTTAIPGWPFLRPGFASGGTTRWFFCPLNDAYGGRLGGLRKLTVGILNRHPRKGCFVTAWLVPAGL